MKCGTNKVQTLSFTLFKIQCHLIKVYIIITLEDTVGKHLNLIDSGSNRSSFRLKIHINVISRINLTFTYPNAMKFQKIMKLKKVNLNEQRHEKTSILHICENKGADQLHSNCKADQRLCFRYTNRTIPLLPKPEISSLWPSSVPVQLGLCRTCSETTFLVCLLMTWLSQHCCCAYSIV